MMKLQTYSSCDINSVLRNEHSQENDDRIQKIVSLRGDLSVAQEGSLNREC